MFVKTSFHKSVNFIVDYLEQGWPTFLLNEPNSDSENFAVQFNPAASEASSRGINF